MRVAGIMSGTSLDGIDVAVIDIRARKFDVVSFSTTPYPREVRERLLGISNRETHTAEVSRLNFLLPELYAKAVAKCGVPLQSIELVGCHGQTIFHERSNTLQIGNGCVLAERLGIPVVSDFRARDVAAGGHGAPLVPYFDVWLYRHSRLGRVALNIGGIANITAISPGSSDAVAFDTGPGNMVIDTLVSELTAGRRTFDNNGAIGARGTVQRDLVARLLRDRYYRMKPPKTAGREQYGREFVAALHETGLATEDLIATMTAFTAATIAEGVRRFVPHRVDEMIASGGGVHNRTMMNELKNYLPGVRIRTSDEFGVNSDAKEAVAFAVMAWETFRRRPSNVPSATGAKRAVVLGKISW
ncbi:MAG TPA: anhydro-N-acetylmuramic acid kinase [Bryobacteraceae bacterium]|nr:anhydro-N-acetylmuramic acid kinase [Bryobacteraceae bacterium]